MQLLQYAPAMTFPALIGFDARIPLSISHGTHVAEADGVYWSILEYMDNIRVVTWSMVGCILSTTLAIFGIEIP